jgi:hypothetical protein
MCQLILPNLRSHATGHIVPLLMRIRFCHASQDISIQAVLLQQRHRAHLSDSFLPTSRTQRLHFQVGCLGGNGEYAESIRVTQATLPSLHGNDGRTGLQNVEGQGAAETEADTVVNLGG